MTTGGEVASVHASGQLPLMIWLSPAFPVGAFAYSHGLEWAREAGDLEDAAALEGWLGDLLRHGAPRNDAVLLATSHAAIQVNDDAALIEVAELALALATSRERHLETVAQGGAFVLAARKAWPCAALDELASAWGGDVAYPVALGTLAAGHGIGRPETVEAFLLALVSNLVSAAVRLGVVGQSDGQRVIAALLPQIRETASFAVAATLDDLGGAAFRSDLAALRHETQYTRLFRS